MTREAIKFFERLISETERVLADRPEKLREVETVLPYYRMAIEALLQPPSENYDKVIAQLETEIESSNKYIREYDGSKEQVAYNEGMRNALRIVKLCVTEQSPRPKGRWIEHSNDDIDSPSDVLVGYDCSKCGGYEFIKSSFCPNCGADMRESEQE